jgi:hypothetical protein
MKSTAENRMPGAMTRPDDGGWRDIPPPLTGIWKSEF